MNYDRLVTKDTDDHSFSPSRHMSDLESVEAYWDEPETLFFINSFSSVNGWQSSEKVVRDHLNFQKHSLIHDINHIFLDSWEDMVWKDR